ncbi:ABC transporter ATP-binding protein [Scardovia wiggsiae]|uniref:ABC transporter ATP-binding protein n=1 Tax=Scardovia wiggsiae TaxID=230143 RepID=UPI001CAC6BC2|nr:ABC transporter ATP-binding protein [Scardovia wiggsiae]
MPGDERTVPVLMARNVTMDYRTGGSDNPQANAVRALDNVNLDIIAGSSLSIMGPSGSGKTTLLHVLAGILRPTQGTVVYKNRDMATLPDAYRTRLRRSDFGFVFQSGQLIEELSAEENVALPLMLSGADYKKAVAAASDWLERLGLQQLASHRPGEMSGGQRQRIAIARALAISPSVIFADEPTGALDQATGEQIIELLTGWCARTGASLIMVTHDPNVARSCQMTIHMQDGRILA